MNVSENPIAVLMSPADPVAEFVNYCNQFYNDEFGVYPIASSEEISQAVGEYLETLVEGEFCGDSLDRERVRGILQPHYSML